ncbi:MAG TPA: hypothetical protein PL009_10410 [Flavipsychrobacter sp.]|nr:hypothetical protein [Flavipsychrobacter sp.]
MSFVIRNLQLTPFWEKNKDEFILLKATALKTHFPVRFAEENDSLVKNYVAERLAFYNKVGFFLTSSISFFIDFELRFPYGRDLIQDSDFKKIAQSESIDELEKLSLVKSLIIQKYLSKK